MAKKRNSRKVRRNASRSSQHNQIKSPPLISIRRRHMTQAGWFFLNLLAISVFVYGLYLLWTKPWTQGVSLIAALFIIILAVKAYYKIKRK